MLSGPVVFAHMDVACNVNVPCPVSTLSLRRVAHACSTSRPYRRRVVMGSWGSGQVTGNRDAGGELGCRRARASRREQ
jgi:hypothetical protein